jgi:hypothetical protein
MMFYFVVNGPTNLLARDSRRKRQLLVRSRCSQINDRFFFMLRVRACQVVIKSLLLPPIHFILFSRVLSSVRFSSSVRSNVSSASA